MNVCLNLSGKIILGDNETLLDKINHFKKYINFDKIYMHIWADDYIKYFNEIQFIKNCSVIVVTPPIIDENYYCPHFFKIKTPYEYKAHSNVFQFYGLQCVFQQSCLEDNDIHIRCKNKMNLVFQIKLSEVIVFQKLTNQETVILKAMKYLE